MTSQTGKPAAEGQTSQMLLISTHAGPEVPAALPEPRTDESSAMCPCQAVLSTTGS